VLCEKPLAVSVEDVDAVTAAARATGRVVAEAFMYRHHLQTLRVKALLDEGVVGKVRIVRGAFAFWLDREHDVRLDPDQGGGALWDVGCYPVSFARFALDEEPVEAVGMADVGPAGVDLTFAGQLRFASDAVLQFDCSFRTDFRVLMEFVGAEGTLLVPNPFKPREREQLVLRRGDQQQTIDVAGGPLYLGELDDMADAIEQDRPPRVTLAESRGNVAALLALLESARTGRVVALGGR
jgi:predicted dehydrogenase